MLLPPTSFGIFLYSPTANQSLLFDQSFGDGLLGISDDHIDALEVIGCFDYIIYIDNTVLHANGVGFVDIPCLVMGQAAALNVIGVVGKVDLDFVIDSTFDMSGHFIL